MTHKDRNEPMPARKNSSLIKDEQGFVLVLTMAILVVLSLIGISATNLTEIELQIAGNDRVHKETFYRADAGTEIGMRLVYDNAVCDQVNDGFDATTGTTRTFSKGATAGTFVVTDLVFSAKRAAGVNITSDPRAVAYYPPDNAGVSDAEPHTNLWFAGETKYSPGYGLQMISGYEGLGSSGISASHVEYDIISQHQGVLNSESVITLGWRLNNSIVNNASSQDCRAIYKN
jgi:hypothetical protein